LVEWRAKTPAVKISVLIAIAFATSCDRSQSNRGAPEQGGAGEAICTGTVAGGEVFMPGGTFEMGTNGAYPEEMPVIEVTVGSFWIDITEVTNAEFAVFVEATGYQTQAEKGLKPEDFPEIAPQFHAPGSMVFTPPDAPGSPFTWWAFAPGANWRHPSGPESSIEGRDNYPVVHVTHDDAAAYAQWAGRRLPSEAEWEFAVKGGAQKPQAGAAAPAPADANVWQGLFPMINTGLDGHKDIAPRGCYAPNGFGLFDMIGNVWELTSSTYFPGHGPLAAANEFPQGFDPSQPGIPVHVIKGGSYLCAENYCRRYRPEARQAMDTFLGASHVGFRTVRDG